MAKRTNFGSIYKGSTGDDGKKKPDYAKVSRDVSLKKGQYINLESKESQTVSLKRALEKGTLSQENYDKAMERVAKIPDFVRFELVVVEQS